MSASTKSTPLWRVVKAAGIFAGVVAGLVCLLTIVLTLYLTPGNLTQLLNREASGYFNADFRISNARFTLWSTFPHLFLEIDSLRIDSRSLRGISPEIRRQLPPDAGFLASTGKIKGSVNVLKLISGGVWMKDLTIDCLDLNLVAYDDSIANYNIVPDDEKREMGVPYFTAGSIILQHPRPVRFFSAATQTEAEALIKNARLVRDKKTRDRYKLILGGEIDAEVRKIAVLSGFPFSLKGNVEMQFHPFRLGFSNFDVDLGDTRGRLDMSLNLGENVRINNLSYRIQAFDLMRFLRFLPGADPGIIKGLHANLSVDASARLTAPFVPSATRLPSFEVDFSMPAGHLSYTLSNGQSYSMSHSSATGRFIFDGTSVGRSCISLAPLTICSDGLTVSLAPRIDSLLSNPRATTIVSFDADLCRLGRLAELKRYDMAGHIRGGAKVSFSLESLTAPAVDDIVIEGMADLTSFSVLCGSPSARIKGDRVKIGCSGMAGHLSREVLQHGALRTYVDAGDVILLTDDVLMRVEGLHVDGLSRSESITASMPKMQLPYVAKAAIKSLEIAIPSDSIRINGSDMVLNADACVGSDLGPGSGGVAELSAGTVGLEAPEMKIVTSGFYTSVSADRLVSGSLAPVVPDSRMSYPDSLPLSRIRHTPEYVSMRLSKGLCDFINSFRLKAEICAERGRLSTPRYPDAIRFSGLGICATPDSIRLEPLSMEAGSTSARLSASAGNLRRAFTSAEPVAVPVDISLALDTVNINYLARIYEDVNPYSHTSAGEEPDDSMTLLIPRNLDMRMQVSAKETVYTDLHLYDLSTMLTLRDGIGRVNDLRIASDFGHAYLDLGYDSGDIRHISMDAEAGVMQVDVVKFFQRFHTLLLMMPQMKNLSGYVSAEMKGGLDVFPDMDVNLPSLHADVALQGRDLKVHQDEFIRRITRMMLIPDSRDLNIRNMNVRASVHDNLVELYPFDFEFSKYRLRMLGLNNFNGRLYYHIGVEENPLHLPFGINIEGDYSHPRLSFGGASYKEKNGSVIASRVMVEKRFNVVREARIFIREFLHKAAVSSAD